MSWENKYTQTPLGQKSICFTQQMTFRMSYPTRKLAYPPSLYLSNNDTEDKIPAVSADSDPLGYKLVCNIFQYKLHV